MYIMKSLHTVEVIVLGSGSYAPPSRLSPELSGSRSRCRVSSRAVTGPSPKAEGSVLRRNYPVRNPSGYAVNIPPRGEILIFDFGSGSLRNLVRAGMNFMDISHIFITHFHIDHWLDILSLLFLFHFVFKPKNGSLTIAGPAGIKKFLGKLMSTCKPYTNPNGYRLIIREIKEGQTFSPKTDRPGRDWTVRAKTIKHCKPSFCYRLEYYPSGCPPKADPCPPAGRRMPQADKRPKSITYTGDASYEKGLVEFAKDSDLLITDCTLPGPKAKYGHMTLEQAVKLARRSGSGKTVLSHISPNAESAVRRKAGKDLNPSIVAGHDLMRIKI